MTRRSALTAMALITGAYAGALDAQETWTTSRVWAMPEVSFLFDLNAAKAYTFTLGEKTVTFTPDEIMDALTS